MNQRAFQNQRCRPLLSAAVALCLGLSACSDDGVGSEEDARKAYAGLDIMIGKAMDLGFKGFNEAKSANIPQQQANGNVKGTLTINGQVDQGTSDNKGMRLTVVLLDYADDPQIDVTYATGAAPALNLSLKKIPSGTLDGTLGGIFRMAGGLQGDVALNLTMAGQLEGTSAADVHRKPGTTHVTGTATSPYGTYQVNITR